MKNCSPRWFAFCSDSRPRSVIFKGENTRNEKRASGGRETKFIRTQTFATKRTLFASSILFWLFSSRILRLLFPVILSLLLLRVSLVLSRFSVRALACIRNRRESCDDWRKSIQFRRISNSIIWTCRVGEEQAGECKCDKWVWGGIIRRSEGTKSTATSGCSAWPTRLS